MTTALKIALTGGIASGKTQASSYFAELGVPVIDTDVIARKLVVPGSEALKKIIDHFGDDILKADGQLNRAALRSHIFKNNQDKLWLEALLHPLILQQVENDMACIDAHYCIIVIPLLAESEPRLAKKFDRILLIDATETQQIERLCARDGMDTHNANNILSQQASREQRLAIADDVIENNASLDVLKQNISKQHQAYLGL